MKRKGHFRVTFLLSNVTSDQEKCTKYCQNGNPSMFLPWYVLLSMKNEHTWLRVLRYDRQSVGQSVLEQSTLLGLTTRYLLLSDSCGFVDLGRPLWREDGSVVYNCSWSTPAQSFSNPSPVGLVAIFYCLIFEISLCVGSNDSQGHGGGIRPRLHTGVEHTSGWSTLRNLSADRICHPLPQFR
jgi:hypothetical protein